LCRIFFTIGNNVHRLAVAAEYRQSSKQCPVQPQVCNRSTEAGFLILQPNWRIERVGMLSVPHGRLHATSTKGFVMQITARAVFENGSWLLNVPQLPNAYGKVSSLFEANTFLNAAVQQAGLDANEHELSIDLVPETEWFPQLPDALPAS